MKSLIILPVTKTIKLPSIVPRVNNPCYVIRQNQNSKLDMHYPVLSVVISSCPYADVFKY
jgi:hypothetical protein